MSTAASNSASVGESHLASESDGPETNPVAQAGRYYVAGTLFDEETKQPIAEASLRFLIVAEHHAEDPIRTVSTDNQGRFHLEVPLGTTRLFCPGLKPGYWLEQELHGTNLGTYVETPVATLDISAKRGPVWPFQITVEDGISEIPQPFIIVLEIEKEATRTMLANGETGDIGSSSRAYAWLDSEGRGAFTQCGTSGKLCVCVSAGFGREVTRIWAELLVDPAFEVTKVKTATPITGTDKVELIDENGATATVGKAEVTITNGQPLLTFHLRRNRVGVQEVFGRVVDEVGQPIHEVCVGTDILRSVTTNTDCDGRFRLQVPLFETYSDDVLILTFNQDGYAGLDSEEIPLPKQPVEAIDVGQFTLDVGRSLPVRVVVLHDEAVAGAGVMPESSYAGRKSSIRTDAQGRGVLRNLPPGVLQVCVSHAIANDYVYREIVVSPIDAENTEATLRIQPFPTPRDANVTSLEPMAIGQIAPDPTIEQDRRGPVQPTD